MAPLELVKEVFNHLDEPYKIQDILDQQVEELAHVVLSEMEEAAQEDDLFIERDHFKAILMKKGFKGLISDFQIDQIYEGYIKRQEEFKWDEYYLS